LIEIYFIYYVNEFLLSFLCESLASFLRNGVAATKGLDLRDSEDGDVVTKFDFL